jgi:hypothetical protein
MRQTPTLRYTTTVTGTRVLQKARSSPLTAVSRPVVKGGGRDPRCVWTRTSARGPLMSPSRSWGSGHLYEEPRLFPIQPTS